MSEKYFQRREIFVRKENVQTLLTLKSVQSPTIISMEYKCSVIPNERFHPDRNRYTIKIVRIIFQNTHLKFIVFIQKSWKDLQ